MLLSVGATFCIHTALLIRAALRENAIGRDAPFLDPRLQALFFLRASLGERGGESLLVVGAALLERLQHALLLLATPLLEARLLFEATALEGLVELRTQLLRAALGFEKALRH